MAIALALVSHEQALPALVGLIAWAWVRRHPARRTITVLCTAVILVYVAGTASMHRGHPVSGRIADGLIGRMLIYPAAFILPAQAPVAVARALSVADASEINRVAITVSNLAGLVVVALAVFVARRAGRVARDAAALGLLLFLLALALPRPAGWVEARHFYPVSAFLVPALLEACPGTLPLQRRGLHRAAVALVALWGAGILIGSIYIQYHAAALARDPGTIAKLEMVKRASGR